MKTRAALLLLVSTLTGLLATPALAEDAATPYKTEKTTFYLAGYGGYTIPGQLTGITGANGFTVPSTKRDLSDELIGGVKIGFTPSPNITWFMWELDGSYTGSKIAADPPLAEAQMGVWTLAINSIIRYPGTFFQPYAGVGPIIARASCFQCGGSDTALGLGFLVGSRFAMGDHLMVFVEYKYNKTNFSWTNFNGHWDLNAFVAGVGWNF